VSAEVSSKGDFQAIYDPSSWTSWKANRTVGATFASQEDAMAGITFETNERRGDFALSTTFALFCSSPRKCDCRRRDRGDFLRDVSGRLPSVPPSRLPILRQEDDCRTDIETNERVNRDFAHGTTFTCRSHFQAFSAGVENK
jgi:hypothetical protein